MKAETPQILWHNGKDNEQNKNAPIYSISVLESGLAEDGVVQSSEFGLVLATAGNTEVNLWKLRLQSSDDPALYSKLDRSTPYRMVNSQLLTTLSRHDATVNCIAFSPNGLHLATASDSGTVIIYSIPPSKRGNGNGRHFWSTLGDSTIENSSSQLSMKIISGHDGIYDLDWSPDSKRFMVGTLDHSIAIYEDENYNANLCQPLHKDSQWKCIYRNSRDHSHYVQGVAMDPLNYYAASMSCDRTVRVFGRKSVKTKSMRTTVALTQNRLELGKGKLIKYRTLESTEPPDSDAPKQRQALFAEEAASESFFRRLSWTTDGSYLVTPAVLWGDDMATCLFRRHAFDQPARVLLGHDKPSRVVAANPILYCLPDDVESFSGLAYKTVFCVLTENSILIYDTYHTKPLAMARGLHFSGLTDAIWTPNGRALIVSSSDGYLSVIQFEEGELGKVYVKPPTPPVVEGVETNKQLATSDSTEQPEAKRARLVSPATVRERFHPESQLEQSVPVESGQADENREAAGSSTKSDEAIVNVLQPKKKKRAQLHLVSTNVSSGN